MPANAPVAPRVLPDKRRSACVVAERSAIFSCRVCQVVGNVEQLTWLSLAPSTTTPVARVECGTGPVSASVSPDGRWIAYGCVALANAGRPEATRRPIMIVASDGGTPHPLTVAGGVERFPIWSPDGTRLFFADDVSGTTDLWAVEMTDGSAAGAPVLVRREIGTSRPLVASRDGRVFFHDEESALPESSIATLTSPGRPSSTTTTILGGTPSWSPDGRSIAVLRARPGAGGTHSLVVRSLGDGTERIFRHDGLGAARPLWFGDGDSILVLLHDGGGGHWARLVLATGEFERLMPNRANPGVLTHWTIRALAPDGGTLYFGVYRGPETLDAPMDRVVAADLRTGAYRTVFMLPGPEAALPRGASDFTLAISPDGRTLAVEVADPQSRRATIWSVGVDGGQRRALCTFIAPGNVGEQLDWTRDGGSLVYTEAGAPPTPGGDASYRVMRMAANGGAPAFTGVARDWFWTLSASPDGSRVVFDGVSTGSARDRVWTLALPPR